MNRLFFRDQIRENPAFLAKLLVFNKTEQALGFSLNEPLQHLVLSDARLCSVLRQKGLLKSSSAQAASYWAFTDESQRLALLKPDDLKYIGRLASAAIYAHDIALSISKSDVLALKDFLGEPIYDWTIKRGRFQMSEAVRMHYQTPLAAVPALTERVRLMSRLSLEMLRSNWPKDLLEKSEPLFSSLDLPRLPDEIQRDVPHSRKLWYIVKKLVLRESQSEWTHFFK